MKKRKIDASVLLLVLIILLLAAGALFAVFFLRPNPINESPAADKIINALFVIENDDKSPLVPLCSYVLMYSPVSRRAAVFDIPGSLGQVIERANRVDRLDTVYDPRRIAPFVREIEKLMDIEISFSVVISLENLGKIVDIIEGVELFIPSSVDDYQEGYILFPSGISFLDGDKAKVYITYELPEESSELADFRRQRFFLGFIKRLGEQNRFLKIPQVSRLFHSLMRTGMNQQAQARLFDEFSKIDPDRVSIQSVTGNVREVSGQTLIFPYWDGSLIKEIVRQTSGSLTQPAENLIGDRTFTVEILNGTTVNGLAGRTAELFRGFGYDIVAIGNADSNDYEKTLIIDRSGYQNVVTTFGEVIRCDNIRYDSAANAAANMARAAGPDMELDPPAFEYRPDITLIIGKDFNGRHVTE